MARFATSIGRLLREPLLHFLLVGLMLFAASQHYREANDRYRIVIDETRIAALGTAYQSEFGEPPSAETLGRLVDEYAEAEVLYREGMARGFGHDDEIVRRRIIQKVAFIESNRDPPAAPDEQQLRQWFEAHAKDYTAPGTVDFSHIFFAAEAGDEAAAKMRASIVLSSMPPSTQRAPERGDPFPDLHDFSRFGPQEARRLFAHSEMAGALFAAEQGEWSGPFRSPFGWHLVRVSQHRPGGKRSFQDVKDEVLADYLEDIRRTTNRERIERIRSRYKIVRPQ